MLGIWMLENGIMSSLFPQVPNHHNKNDAFFSSENEWKYSLVHCCI